jgi:hypothetical protein
VVECACESKVVGSLLGVCNKDEKRGVVLGRKELEGGSILEWVDCIFLGELDCMGLLECVLKLPELLELQLGDS